MAKDVTNSAENVEMVECEEDKVVTMMEVLQEQEDFEENANAVLGASDDKNCTYSKGYIKRQALYACMTCCSEAKSDPTKRAGICLACSLICHENHELVELYTKRNFRCDCGNSKFTSHPCQLAPNKALENEENNYNQNFSGLYCVCQRPYPDPENKVVDEMIQCTVCEDWLHTSHLETSVPAVDQYTEMICKGCMEKNDFLYSYSNLVVNIDNTNVDIININEYDNKSSNIFNSEAKTERTDKKIEDSVQSQESEDIDISEKNSETSCAEPKTENNQNIEKNIIASEIPNNHDSKDNTDIILCEKESLNKSAEISSDSQISSDKTVKLANEVPESENVKLLQDLNTDSNKAEDITEIKKDESHSDNISEQNTTDNPLKETLKGISVSEINNDKVTSQEKDSLKQTEDFNNSIEVAISNQDIKDEERMEEDRLLADPESDESNSKSNLNDEKTTHTLPNANSDRQIAESESSNSKQDVDIKTLSLPNNDQNECSNSNSEKHIKNEILNLPNNDQEQSTKLENEVSQDPPASTEMVINSEHQEYVNNELSKENITNNKELESKSENFIENNIIAATSKEESGSSEQSTSKLSKETEPNSPDKVTEKRKLPSQENSDNLVVKKTKLDNLNNIKSCICPINVKKVHRGATFWPSNFRQKLCTCRECLTLYKDLSVLFLIDPEDTVSAYESLGIEKSNGKPSNYEKGLEALSSLDRTQQINALTEYNKMRDKLLEFLKSFKDRKEIVKEEDIKAFFAEMKPTREPDGVYFCR